MGAWLRSILVLLGCTVASAAKLVLGAPGEVRFGSDSSPVTLSATCDAESATVTMVRPQSFQMDEARDEVRMKSARDRSCPACPRWLIHRCALHTGSIALWQGGEHFTKVSLGNVVPSCEIVSSLRTPCASPADADELPPPLFWCKYVGTDGEHVHGPLGAVSRSVSVDGVKVGFGTSLDCPIPQFATLLSLGPFTSGGALKVNLSIVHYQSDGHELRFDGQPGGNVLTLDKLHHPPSPPLPRAPVVAATTYVHYGSRTCGSGSTLLYEGYVVGSSHDVVGGSVGGMCFHSSPQSPSDQTSGSQAARSHLMGAEYQTSGSYSTPGSVQFSHDTDVACAVCQRTGIVNSYVQWGRGTSCSNGHTTLYSGWVMGERDTHYRAESLCIDSAMQAHSASSGSDQNGYLLYMAEMIAGSIDESAYPNGVELGCSECAGPASDGAVYVHYGSRTCGSGSTLLYEGYVVGSSHDVVGGSVGGMCFHSSPQSPSDQTSGSQAARSHLMGAEYQTSGSYSTPGSVQFSHDTDVACAVCQRTGIVNSYVQWGRGTSCSNGHTTLYSGWVMGERDTHYRAESLCIDSAMQAHSASSGSDQNGYLLYMAEMIAGSIDESAYPNGVELGCSLCGVPA